MKGLSSPKGMPFQVLAKSLVYFLIMLVISLSIVLGIAFTSRTRLLREYKLKAMTQLEYQGDLLQHHFQSVRSDLLFLPQLNEMIRFMEVSSERDRVYIESEFLEFTRSKVVYDQIRYIDSSGREKTRINFNAGRPTIVKKEDLQDKSDRYYFSSTISLQEGEIYISPFDLNKEQGEIEVPLKPMIRFGTPVFDSRKNRKGIIILNYLGETLLEDLRVAGANNPGQFFLLNMDGYWLYSENAEDPWGFMYPSKQDLTLSRRNPEIWQHVSRSMKTQFLIEGSLVSSLIITPFPDLKVHFQEQSWILMNTISLDEMGLSRNLLISNISYIILIIVALCAVLSWLLGRAVVHKNLYRKALEHSALYDRLTGLPNRKLLEERGKQVLEEARRYYRKYALIFIDLDGFKAVNDTLGHDAGDDLLKQVGERMIQCVRSSDTVCRFGGDEFIILLSQIENKEDCGTVARKILDSLSKEFSITGGKADIGGSLGIAIGYPDRGKSLESLIQKADSAMYDVKNSGKNNYKIV